MPAHPSEQNMHGNRPHRCRALPIEAAHGQTMMGVAAIVVLATAVHARAASPPAARRVAAG